MVRIIPSTRKTIHGTPAFICGGAVDFGLAALYLPIRCGSCQSDRNCYAYGRDRETTDQFTIRVFNIRMPSDRRMRLRPAAETGYSGVGFSRLETLIAQQVRPPF